MVRDCYQRIVDLILETDKRGAGAPKRRFGMVVTGTPGIGKSPMALYLICCLAKQHQKIVYRWMRVVGSMKAAVWQLLLLECIPWACAI